MMDGLNQCAAGQSKIGHGAKRLGIVNHWRLMMRIPGAHWWPLR